MASNRASPSPGLSTTPSTKGTKENKKKNLVQLNIKSASATVKNTVVSDKKATKKPRLSSSDQNPVGASDTTGEITGENDLHSILESLQEIKQGMVTKTDISVVVKNILSELKGDFVKEIKTAIKDEIKKELKTELKTELKGEIEKFTNSNVDEKLKQTRADTNEKFDALNMDLTDIREKIAKEKRELQKMSDDLRITTKNAQQAISMANFNQQYSQKCNIKILGWREKSKEDLKQEFCAVLKQRVKVDVNPHDILAIHRVPGNRNGGPRPIIVRMISPESKTLIMKHRKQMKEEFLMVDHITQQNAMLIQKLKEHELVHSAWYFNSKVFAIDKNDRRYTFDIFDDINKKLRA